MISFDFLHGHYELIHLTTLLVAIVVLLMYLRHQVYHQWHRIAFAAFVAVASLYNFQSAISVPLISIGFVVAGIIQVIHHFQNKERSRIHLDLLKSKITIFKYEDMERDMELNEEIDIHEFRTKLIHKDEESMVFISDLEPNKRYEMYCSDFDKKFTVLSGGIELFMNGREYTMQKGMDISIMKFDNHYYIVSPQGCKLRVDCINPNIQKRSE